MYSNKYLASINKHPDSADGLRKLQDYFRRLEERDANLSRLQLPAERVAEISEAKGYTELSRLLRSLLEDQLMTRLMVLESSAGGAILELNIEDSIPAVVHDWRQDVQIAVALSDLVSIYRPNLQ